MVKIAFLMVATFILLSASISLAITKPKFNRTAAAKAIAVAKWGAPCNGEFIPVTKEVIPPFDNQDGTKSYYTAEAKYSYKSAEDLLPPFTQCSVVFDINEAKGMPWEKFCTIMVHEYGHLVGVQHSKSEFSLMYYTYLFPYKKCENR